MIQLDGSAKARRTAIDRRADRLVAVTAIVVALGYLIVAALAAFLPTAQRVGSWLPLHLALAGGAATAVAGVMPFFSAAFAAAQPVDARIRWSSVAAVAVGAAGVTLGYALSRLELAAISGLLFAIGIVLVAVSTFAPLRGGLGPRGGIVALGYGAALAMVIVGAVLAALFLAGWPPVASAWATLRPAHAWLNLMGFVSLVVATTLLHFFPTVIGARIQRNLAAHATLAGLGLGSALVAVGFALRSDLVSRLGAILVIVGAIALAVYCWAVWRTRGTWRTDEEWHRFAMAGLISAIAWFEVGVVIAAGRVLLTGADPAASGSDPIIGPLVVGWMGLAVLASATHLVPAVGPGGSAAHARQRQVLGRWATIRLVVANVGVAALSLGVTFGLDVLSAAGMAAVAAALLSTAGLLVLAVLDGIRDTRTQPG